MKDEELRTLIQQQMRQDAGNPYFTRKVLNRLPQKQPTTYGLWILRAVYLIATVLLGTFWLHLILQGDMFGRNLIEVIVLWPLTLFTCYAGLQNLMHKTTV